MAGTACYTVAAFANAVALWGVESMGEVLVFDL